MNFWSRLSRIFGRGSSQPNYGNPGRFNAPTWGTQPSPMPVPTGLQYQGPVDSGYQSNPISGDTGITAPIGYGSGGYIQSINNQKWTPPITSAPIKVAQSNLSIVQHLFNGMFGSRFS